MASTLVANFEEKPVAAPAVYRRFSLHNLYMHRTKTGPGATQAVLVQPSGIGLTHVSWWLIYNGHGIDAKVVARALGLHVGTGTYYGYHTLTFAFEDERFKGATLQAMGTVAKNDDEYSIVGGTREFAMVNGVINRVLYTTGEQTDIDKLTITGLIPVLDESQVPVQSPVIKIGPWGGNGGSEAIVGVPPHRLQSVTIRSAQIVDSLAYSYTDRAGQKHVAGPWGGNGGNAATIELANMEFIKEVSGTTGTFGAGNVVTSLKFVTNLQSYGPFGVPTGTPFSVPVHGDNGIVGFFGRAGKFLDVIGVYARA